MAKDRARDPRRSVEHYMKGKEKMGRAMGFFSIPGTERHPAREVIGGKTSSFTPGKGHVTTGMTMPVTGAFIPNKPRDWQGQEGIK